MLIWPLPLPVILKYFWYGSSTVNGNNCSPHGCCICEGPRPCRTHLRWLWSWPHRLVSVLAHSWQRPTPLSAQLCEHALYMNATAMLARQERGVATPATALQVQLDFDMDAELLQQQPLPLHRDELRLRPASTSDRPWPLQTDMHTGPALHSRVLQLQCFRGPRDAGCSTGDAGTRTCWVNMTASRQAIALHRWRAL